MKTLFWWILSLIVATIIFCVAIILIPMETSYTVEKVELTYIFVDDSGNEYNVFDNKVHWAADDWSFLFDEEDNDLNTGSVEDDEWYLPNKDYIDEDVDDENINWKEITLLEDDELDALIEEERVNQQWSWETISGEIEIFEDCISPWNNVIKHNESVLAYQQRSDVPTICNVQRRKCDDWELKWSYDQASCEEYIKYEYTRVAVISWNDNKPWELIQTSNSAKNDSALFDTDGKIDTIDDGPDTSWNNDYNAPVVDDISTDLTHKNYNNCITPWWEIVAHGQFTRAYESPLWFVDEKCQVELRLCLNWILKWHYSYRACDHKNVTYQDYRAWNDDITKPTPDLMIETLTEWDIEDGGLFWWIGGLFN